MAESNNAAKVDPHLVADIVRGYVTKNSIACDQLGGLISTVRHTLGGLLTKAAVSVPGTPAVPLRRSVLPGFVTCLECGFRGKVLRRHIRTAHGLDPTAYRVRWNLTLSHPLTAPEYSTRRSAMAKHTGLGRKRPALQMPAPVRRGRPRQVGPAR